MSEISDAFAPVEDDDRWFNPGGLDEARLTELEAAAGQPIPEPVKELLRYTAGGEWAGSRLVQFFDDLAIGDVNTELGSKWLPGTFAFASDGGPRWYILDVENRLGRGAGAVWSLPAGAPFESQARYVAEDIPAFLRWMIEGG